jgi:hypothetical protein
MHYAANAILFPIFVLWVLLWILQYDLARPAFWRDTGLVVGWTIVGLSMLLAYAAPDELTIAIAATLMAIALFPGARRSIHGVVAGFRARRRAKLRRYILWIRQQANPV